MAMINLAAKPMTPGRQETMDRRDHPEFASSSPAGCCVRIRFRARIAWCVALAGWLAPLDAVRGQWIAFNDIWGGPDTHPNTTRYHPFEIEADPAGPLKDVVSGAELPVLLTLSHVGGLGERFGGVPAPGTPLHNAFAGYVDFAGNGASNTMAVRMTGSVLMTLTGLDPEKKYEVALGAVRGLASASPTRWTLLELSGADSFEAAHTGGVLTQTHAPELASNQAAVSFEINHTPETGDLGRWTAIDPGPDGAIEVWCSQYRGTVPGGTSGGTVGYVPTALSVIQMESLLPTILSEPEDELLNEGKPAEFQVVATGSALAYQWYRDDEPIPDATTRIYRVGAPTYADYDAAFYAVVTGSGTSVTSQVARLKVIPLAKAIFGFDQAWRYDATGADLGVSWREPGYDDSGWAQGAGSFHANIVNLQPVQPLTTQLPLTNAANDRIVTYYFRTAFDWLPDRTAAALRLTNAVDDGMIVYLNGEELFRHNMPGGDVTSSTLAAASLSPYTLATSPVLEKELLIGRNELAVEVHQAASSVADMLFAMQLTGQLLVPETLSITESPADAVGYEGGDPVELRVHAISGSPPTKQWFKDGAPVEGATNDVLRFDPARSEQAGEYWVVVANVRQTAISGHARLTVVPSGDGMLHWISVTNEWRYLAHYTAFPFGTNWLTPAFDDSTWLSGPGVLGYATDSLSEPINTVLPLKTANGTSINTFYFRTVFEWGMTNEHVHVVASNLLDDGAVFYLNGAEIQRVRIGPGPVEYATQASVASLDGRDYESFLAQDIPILTGTNHLAVEVHQPGNLSSDVVFGMAMHFFPASPEPVRVIRQPSDLFVRPGFPGRMECDVFGSSPIQFQWFKDGQPVAHGTNEALVIAAVTASDEGSYYVQVENEHGLDQSAHASLLLNGEGDAPVALVRGPYLQMPTTEGVTVRWRTDVPAHSRVAYGTDPTNLDRELVSPVVHTNHEARLEGLAAGTRYYYEIGTLTTNLAGGPDYTFRTWRDAPAPTRVWVMGDSGTAVPAVRQMADAYLTFSEGRETDLWLMLGDNAYVAGTDEQFQGAVFDMFPDLLRRMPLLSAIGNHETYSTETSGQHAYFEIFTLPTQGEAGGVPSGKENYYSFDYGNIHFVALDSELSTVGSDGSMLTWLEADLEACTNDWLIVFWHSPPYTKGSHDSDRLTDSGGRMIWMRENVLPILEAHGVDLVLCGHSHVYERSNLIDGHYGFSGTFDDSMVRDAGTGREGETGAYRKAGLGGSGGEGAVYVVAGSSGQANAFYGMDHPAMLVGQVQIGSLILDIDGLRLDARFLSRAGVVLDHFTVLKGAGPAPFRWATIRREGDWVVASWKSEADALYQLESSAGLVEPEWTPVGGVVTATGATTYWTNTVSGANGLEQYLRVRRAGP